MMAAFEKFIQEFCETIPCRTLKLVMVNVTASHSLKHYLLATLSNY